MTTQQRLPALPEGADIVIVGAGLTGLCAALFIAQPAPAWNILLLDTQASGDGAEVSGVDGTRISAGQRQIALSESSRRLFDRIGLWPAIAGRSAAITEIRVSDRGHGGHALLAAREQGLDSYGHVIDAAGLTEVLSSAVAATPHIRRFATAPTLQLQPKAKGMALKVGDQQVLAALAVLANGQNSLQARILGIGFETKDYGRVAITATLTLADPHRGIAYERFTSHGPIALLPLPDSGGLPRASLVWTVEPDKAEVLLRASDAECLMQLQEAFGSRAGEFVAIGHRRLTPLARTLALEQVRSHLVLMGSAAHSLHPVAGQGFNLSLRDIAALADILAEGAERGQPPGALSLLSRYQQARSADQQRVVAFSDLLPSLFASVNPLLVTGRNLGLLGIDLVPELGGAMARFGAGLVSGTINPGAGW